VTPSQPTLLARIAACRSLPTVPTVAGELIQLTQDPDVAIGTLADVIVQDPALTATLLRHANSPIFGAAGRVTTVRHAIALLGLNSTLILVLGLSLVRGMQGGDQERVAWHERFWRRSVLAAASARALSTEFGPLNSDEPFLAALLQDIGMLVRDRVEPGYRYIVADAKGIHDRVLEIERECLEMDHGEAGAWLLRSWGLPEVFEMAAIGSHYSHDDQAHPIVRCVAAAGWLADALLAGTRQEAWDAARASLQRVLGCSRADLLAILYRIRQEANGAAAMFEVDLGEDIEDLLDQARDRFAALVLDAATDASRSPGPVGP